jgi:hypothetical protein
MEEARWRSAFTRARKDISNLAFSSKKHYETAEDIHRNIRYAQMATTAVSAGATVGSVGSFLSVGSGRVVRGLAVLGVGLSASAAFLTQRFLNVNYAQLPLQHSRAGHDFEALRQEYIREWSDTALNDRAQLLQVEDRFNVLTRKKSELDARMHTFPPVHRQVYLRVKPAVHGPAPRREDGESDADWMRRWTDQHVQQDTAIVDHTVALRMALSPPA